jgi:hypothetical protein
VALEHLEHFSEFEWHHASGFRDIMLKHKLKAESIEVSPWLEAAAAFPFSILEFLMSGIESGAATLEFRQGSPVAAAPAKVSGGKGGKGSGKRGGSAAAGTEAGAYTRPLFSSI